MLDSIFDSVKDQLISSLTEKTGLDTRQAEKAVPMAKDSISDGITGAISSGNLGGILDMVKSATGSGGGGLLENVVYKSISGNFIGKLTANLGIPESLAQQVTAVAIPIILSKLGGKTRDAGDTNDIDEGSLLSTLGLDAGSMLGGLLGSNKAGGGGLGGLLGGMLK